MKALPSSATALAGGIRSASTIQRAKPFIAQALRRRPARRRRRLAARSAPEGKRPGRRPLRSSSAAMCRGLPETMAESTGALGVTRGSAYKSAPGKRDPIRGSRRSQTLIRTTTRGLIGPSAYQPGGRQADANAYLDHHGIVPNFACVNVPVGPSEPKRATRTASAAPSSTVSVPPGFILVFV